MSWFELLTSKGQLGVLIVVVFALGTLTRGVFRLATERRQARKGFLDVWTKPEERNELWREVAIRHLFGEYMPHRMVARVSRDQGAAGLLSVAECWRFFAWDGHRLKWRHPYRTSRGFRAIERVASFVLYVGFVSFGVAAVFAVTDPDQALIGCAAAVVCGVGFLWHGYRLADAERVWRRCEAVLKVSGVVNRSKDGKSVRNAGRLKAPADA